MKLTLHLSSGQPPIIADGLTDAYECARAITRGQWLDLPPEGKKPSRRRGRHPIRTINPSYVVWMDIEP